MAKMTRAEKRRRKVAKLVEMKLDGVEPPNNWRTMSYEQLDFAHKSWLKHGQTTYYGKSLMDTIMYKKAQELQIAMDKAVLEEMINGKPSRPS